MKWNEIDFKGLRDQKYMKMMSNQLTPWSGRVW